MTENMPGESPLTVEETVLNEFFRTVPDYSLIVVECQRNRPPDNSSRSFSIKSLRM